MKRAWEKGYRMPPREKKSLPLVEEKPVSVSPSPEPTPIIETEGVTFAGDDLVLNFDRFDLETYDLFLRAKRLPEYRLAYDPESETYRIMAPSRFAALLGIELERPLSTDLPLSSHLLDDQQAIVLQALAAKRFAVWSDCGLGKSHISLEFARQVLHRTRGRGLIVTLNEIVNQFIREARQYYPSMPLRRIESQAELIEWARGGGSEAAITNYEKFNPKSLAGDAINELRHLSFLILDESSRLKGGGDSKQKKVLSESARGIEYKLSATATPAPNDTIEFVSQATFLEKVRTDQDIIWTYFTRDNVSHRRTVKPHARSAFFDFMASWSVYLKNPKRFGWRLDLPDVPAPKYFTHELPMTPEQREVAREFLPEAFEGLFIERNTNAIERLKMAQIARGFVYRKKSAPERIPSLKPTFTADLIVREAEAGHQVLVWTVFDEESTILDELLRDRLTGYDVLTGDTPDPKRLEILDRFRAGESRVLISRPRMLGYGLNFQCCTSMVFSGFSESFEELYQAVRRAVRFGQKESVRVHFPIVEELEGDTFANLQRKAAEHERATSEMEENYLRSYQALRFLEAKSK